MPVLSQVRGGLISPPRVLMAWSPRTRHLARVALAVTRVGWLGGTPGVLYRSWAHFARGVDAIFWIVLAEVGVLVALVNLRPGVMHARGSSSEDQPDRLGVGRRLSQAGMAVAPVVDVRDSRPPYSLGLRPGLLGNRAGSWAFRTGGRRCAVLGSGLRRVGVVCGAGSGRIHGSRAAGPSGLAWRSAEGVWAFGSPGRVLLNASGGLGLHPSGDAVDGSSHAPELLVGAPR